MAAQGPLYVEPYPEDLAQLISERYLARVAVAAGAVGFGLVMMLAMAGTEGMGIVGFIVVLLGVYVSVDLFADDLRWPLYLSRERFVRPRRSIREALRGREPPPFPLREVKVVKLVGFAFPLPEGRRYCTLVGRTPDGVRFKEEGNYPEQNPLYLLAVELVALGIIADPEARRFIAEWQARFGARPDLHQWATRWQREWAPEGTS